MKIKPFTIEHKKQQETKAGIKDTLSVKVYINQNNYKMLNIMLEDGYNLDYLLDYINKAFKEFITEQSK